MLTPGERLKRRAERKRRIEASPNPEIVRDVQGFLAAYDDIQDAFVTLAVLARLGTRFYPPAERIARWLAGSADVLNAGQNLASLRALSKKSKRDAVKRFASLPNTYRRRLADTLRTKRFGLRVTEVLQAAQTTDTILGVGVSLGAVMSLPVEAAALAVTGGDLVLTPFPADVKAASDLLGDWRTNIRLRSNPPLRLQVDQARNSILTARSDELEALRKITAPSARQRRRITQLEGLGADITAQELALALRQQATVTMLPAFGVLDLAGAFFPSVFPPQRLAEARAAGVPAFTPSEDPHVHALYLAAAAGEVDAKRMLEIISVPASWALQNATKVLNLWKKIAPAKDDLTDDEHLAALAALHLAWRIAGPLFSIFDYTAPEIPPETFDQEHTTYTEALNSWGDRITDSAIRTVAQDLTASTAALIMRHIDEPGIPVLESLPPLPSAVVRLLEASAVWKSGSPPDGSRIDPNALPLVLGRNIWDELTPAHRQDLHEALSPGTPAAAPPDLLHPAG